MIYFIQAESGGDIKIGTTKGVNCRLGTLRNAHDDPTLKVLGVMEGDKAEETSLHGKFSHLRVGGEWFSSGTDLLAFIAENARPWGLDGDDLDFKLTVEVRDSTRRALASRAGLRGRSIGQIIDALVQEHLADDVAAAKKEIAKGEPVQKGKPRRKPKPPPA